MNRTEYLGDSVYCEFDGYVYILFLSNGERVGDDLLKKNIIILELNVLAHLIEFKNRIEG